MHRSNNAVIMQTEQLGRIEALEEELRSSRGKVADLEQKMMEQDRVIAQLVGDNLDHLQANMRLTAHINSSTERADRMEHRLVLGFCLYPINLGRFSSQYRTDADRCTPTLPR